jgi:2-dehydropantoate 2-reductase
MRILFLGAGAVGGYFGGRLAQSGADVTFLVRPARARQLARDGLRIESPHGDFAGPVKTVLQESIREPFDLVALACKSYDLDGAIAAVAPAVGPATTVLPLLNGVAHLEVLDRTFGRPRVVGGIAHVGVTLAPQGTIRHLNRIHRITYGERDGSRSARLEAFDALLARTPTQHVLSDDIVLAMWEKYVMLASLAGMTCLMRANVGEYLRAAGGESVALALLEECRAVARAEGYAPRPAEFDATRAMLTDRDSVATASMLRDLESGHRVEGDHIIGELVRRASSKGVACPTLHVVHAHLQAYEARRAAQRLPSGGG